MIGEKEFILGTSLLDADAYSMDSLIALYKARWEVENYYRDEKQWLSVEDFMSKSVLGVTQELFATVVMSLITRVSRYLEDQKVENEKREGVPQFYKQI